MSIASDILRINNAKQAIRQTVSTVGVIIPNSAKIDAYPQYVAEAAQTNVPQTEAPWNDVMFIDYDGTILYSYSKADFLALQQWPNNPSHSGLTAQGWNWSKEDADAYVTKYGEIIIGQTYASSDGATKFLIELDKYSLHIVVSLRGAGTINWGDETSESFNIAVGDTVWKEHTYQSPDKYMISVVFNENSNLKEIFRWPSIGTAGNAGYSITKSVVYASGLTQYASIGYALELETLILSPDTPETIFDTQMKAPNLKAIILPSADSYKSSNIKNTGVRFISESKNWEGATADANYNLRKILVRDGTTIYSKTVTSPSAIRSVTFPDTVTQIQKLINGTEIRVFAQTPPRIESTYLGVSSNSKIYVPANSVQAYKEASKWSTAASQIEALP